MAQMDDENVSQAITEAGGCLTLHSKWKSQFDDSEASENETEMKGENLQSPEHKQGGDSPGQGQDQAAVSTTRQLELSRFVFFTEILRNYLGTTLIGSNSCSFRIKVVVRKQIILYIFRITENTSHGSGQAKDQGDKSSPGHERKSVHVEINKPFQVPPAKNSLHIEVNLPLPPTTPKQASTSPEVKQETTGKILQLNTDGAASSKPCVVIPPPPKIEPPPPPADFVPLQHSASAPSFNKGNVNPDTSL